MPLSFARRRSTMPPVSAARSERNLRQVQSPNPIVRNVERDLVSVIHDRPGAQLCALVPPYAVLQSHHPRRRARRTANDLISKPMPRLLLLSKDPVRFPQSPRTSPTTSATVSTSGTTGPWSTNASSHSSRTEDTGSIAQRHRNRSDPGGAAFNDAAADSELRRRTGPQVASLVRWPQRER